MKLIQMTDPLEYAQYIYDDELFQFDSPAGTPILFHIIDIDGEEVGYVATEDFTVVAGPHLYVKPEYRTKEYIIKIDWIFRYVYKPLMKALGHQFLITNCDQDDHGTIRFLTKAGFEMKKVMVAEMKL